MTRVEEVKWAKKVMAEAMNKGRTTVEAAEAWVKDVENHGTTKEDREMWEMAVKQ